MAKSRQVPAPAKAAAVAAAALAGAAGAGGKLVGDRRARRAADLERERGFRLRTGEYVPDGVRRIARGRLDAARERLDGAARRDLADAVHDTRKDLKRLRAVVRLSRDALGEEVYDRENTSLRMAGRRLSGARDAQVLVETLDDLRKRFADDLPAAITDGLRARLQADDERARAALRDDDRAVALTVATLADARTRTASWALDGDGFAALAPGLRRTYRRGRRAIATASREPTTENLHEARKRAKDLWHALQIVRPAAPKRLKKLAREAHHLADLLGDDHDLAVLRDFASGHAKCFADEADRQALLAVIDRRRAVLQRRALAAGRRLYTRKPKAFVRRIASGWEKRAPKHPAPLAG